MALWLGLDFGTSAAKALLVDDTGVVRARAAASYATSRPGGGVAEQDPATYLRAAVELISTCARAGPPDPIGLCGQTPTLVFLDEDGRSVRPAMTWQDVRAREEAAQLGRVLGDPRALFGINLPWSPVYPPAKLRWVADHEPGTVRRTSVLLQPKDVVGMALTGSRVSDLWSCRGLRNLRDGRPASRVLEAAGWTEAVIPEVGPAWASRGPVTKEAAERFGLRAGIPVSVGWTDALSGMLAVGAFDEQGAFILSGTADIVGCSVMQPPDDATPLLLIPRTCAPLSVVYGPVQSTGAAIAWAAELFGPAAVAYEARPSAPPGVLADGAPVFVPYLAGERAPIWRDDVRALFLGLSLEHGPDDVRRAVELGIACADRDVLEATESVIGVREPRVRVAGATAASKRWRETRAAVLGRPLDVLREPEASALGAAMLAACAAGESIERVGRQIRGPLDSHVPDEDGVRAGDAAFARYRRAKDLALAWAGRPRAVRTSGS